MRYVLLLTFGVSGLLIPADLPAQVVDSPFRHIETRHEVGLFGGYLQTHTGSLDLGPNPAPIFGGRYNIGLTGPLQAEVGLGFAPTSRTVYSRPGGLGTGLVAVGEANLVVMLAEAGLRFRLTGPRTWHGFAPYAALTGGVVASAGSASEAEAPLAVGQRYSFGPAFAASLALGGDYFLTERLSVRADVRDHFWRYSFPGPLTASGEREAEWRHNFAISIGAAIHF